MRLNGQNPSVGPDFNPQGSTITTDEQITDALNVPVQAHDYKAANARRESVRDIFSKLSPDEAKELYNRLEKYNHKDALNDKFHGTFSDETVESLKKTLKSRFEPSNGGATETTGATKSDNKTDKNTKKSEVDITGKTKAKDLNDQLKPTGPDAPLKIAARTDLNENDKKAKIHEYLRTASPDDFRKTIEQSASWPKDAQKLLDDTIARSGSGAVNRILTELKPDQQIEMVKRLQAGGHTEAVHTVVGGADETTLNKIAANFQSYPGFGLQNKGGTAIVDILTMRAKQLTTDSQKNLANVLIHHGMPQQPLSSTRAYHLQELFGELSIPAGQALFAHLQSKNDIKNMFAHFQGDPIDFNKQFRGLGNKELPLVKQAFEELAAAQPKGSDLEKIYREQARQAAKGL